MWVDGMNGLLFLVLVGVLVATVSILARSTAGTYPVTSDRRPTAAQIACAVLMWAVLIWAGWRMFKVDVKLWT